ncbi:hypothetical protein T069G_08794 [Trichoderma breve]|uniref:Uncharacterized protein n=1 Tax=Trichoderma breve TaxID=2034170 RepID=A0A9W9B8H3_9HYPO|nr:hypothetical protein T069G_08794 [Trichoderma breve]KAJ4857897.1 hypothetical protein T069G_08794 [Trichoderma breve]
MNVFLAMMNDAVAEMNYAIAKMNEVLAKMYDEIAKFDAASENKAAAEIMLEAAEKNLEEAVEKNLEVVAMVMASAERFKARVEQITATEAAGSESSEDEQNL